MLCPNCRAGCMTDDIYCHRCGTDLTLTSKSLVPTQTHVPTLISKFAIASCGSKCWRYSSWRWIRVVTAPFHSSYNAHTKFCVKLCFCANG